MPAFPPRWWTWTNPHSPPANGPGWRSASAASVAATSICSPRSSMARRPCGVSPTSPSSWATRSPGRSSRPVRLPASRSGARVAVDPIIPCLPRGIDPPCANCARGWASSCLRFDSHVMTGGRSLGFTRGLGAGWAEQVLGHPSMLHPIPDGVPEQGGRPPRADLDRPARPRPPSAGRGSPDPHRRGRHHRPHRPAGRAGLLPGQPGDRPGALSPSGGGGPRLWGDHGRAWDRAPRRSRSWPP